MIDAWRVLNPDKLRYTWRQKKPEIHCRLDFLLVSESLMSRVTCADISTGYKTDHSMVTINIAFHSNPRGPGFWKLNTSFLTEKDYTTQIRTVIAQVYEESKNDDNVNDALLWEMIKLKIREKSMQYAAAKKAKISRKEEELEKTINALQNLVDSNRIGEREKQSALNELEDKRIQLEKIVEYKTKGAILRAKCRWHNEGEKNTKYFLNLEKDTLKTAS